MIPVAAALDALFALVTPVGTETVPLSQAAGRVLRADAVSRRDQPPFAASAMDGYAIRRDDAVAGKVLKVIGESAAGHGFTGQIGAGEALRIFTGAPVPAGADFVALQEDVTRAGDQITLGTTLGENPNIRPRGNDFTLGATLTAPRLLRPADIALLAAMNIAEVTVARRPDVAIIATGDELLPPGAECGPDQIIASNAYGLQAMLRQAGAQASILPIAQDRMEALAQSFALAEGADLVVTIGGASVGDHDLVAPAARAAGFGTAFHKVAMRPGKPLMAGKREGQLMLGLPGNPVSSMVCGSIFMLPLLRAMQGLAPAPAPRQMMPLACDLPANGPREHYQRARMTPQGVVLFDRQDSSLLSVLADADVLVVQPPHHPGARSGEMITVVPLS